MESGRARVQGCPERTGDFPAACFFGELNLFGELTRAASIICEVENDGLRWSRSLQRGAWDYVETLSTLDMVLSMVLS